MILRATSEAIEQAASLIRAGQVVAFPTETVYGLGADATNPAAVARLFEIKARPTFDPLIVHVDGMSMLSAVTRGTPAAALQLVRHFWPGPLTVVLPKAACVPDIVTAGLASVAVRVPDHPAALQLVARSGRPIAAPSANPFGYVSPTTADHVATQLGSQVPLILDAGPCRVGVESTIVSFLGDTPQLLRPGGVSTEEIERFTGRLESAASSPPAAPGLLPRHYAPRIRLKLISAAGDVPVADRAGAALLLPAADPDIKGFAHVEPLSDHGDMPTVAANLFAALRRLDAGPYRTLYAVCVPEHGLGQAIMDRLRRAAGADDSGHD